MRMFVCIHCKETPVYHIICTYVHSCIVDVLYYVCAESMYCISVDPSIGGRVCMEFSDIHAYLIQQY